jgi:hypothetical protein
MMTHPTLVAGLHGALIGLAVAAKVDYHAFQSWKSIDDCRTFEWRTAIVRWLQGAVGGFFAGAGLGAYF